MILHTIAPKGIVVFFISANSFILLFFMVADYYNISIDYLVYGEDRDYISSLSEELTDSQKIIWSDGRGGKEMAVNGLTIGCTPAQHYAGYQNEVSGGDKPLKKQTVQQVHEGHRGYCPFHYYQRKSYH